MIEVRNAETRADQNGFTLVEMLVAMAISSIMLAVIVVTYQSQAQSHMTQQEVVDMHQNARAALDLMAREIRMAGLDPTGNAGAGIYAAGATSAYLHFSRDFTGGESDGADNDSDGTIDEADEWYDGAVGTGNEEIEYRLSNDANNDGVADGFPCSLQRRVSISTSPGSPWQNVADNIEALNFVYLDASSAVIPAPVSSANLANIRSIQVTIIARSNNPVMMRKFTDRNVYANQQGTVLLNKSASPDTVRRIELTTTIQCRNLGL